jgi:micrococcal nuclease
LFSRRLYAYQKIVHNTFHSNHLPFGTLHPVNGRSVQGHHDIVIYVLLAGIDAPEIGSRKHQRQQPYGQEAKKYLENVILNKIADIKAYGIGLYPYNHLIGEIYVEDKNINIEMIKEGFAEVCTERPPEGLNITPYLEAEREAKAAGRGMWSLGDKYMSPAQWRKMHKGG